MFVRCLTDTRPGSLTRDKIYKVIEIVDDYYYRLLDDKDVDCVFQPEIFVIAPVLKVRYIGNYYKFSLIKNNTYDVLAIEDDWYRIIDETEEDYLFHKNDFEIIEQLD